MMPAPPADLALDLPQGNPATAVIVEPSHTIRAFPMRRFGMKALLTILTVNRSSKREPDWDLIIIMASTIVTVGLVALYAYGKATARW